MIRFIKRAHRPKIICRRVEASDCINKGFKAQKINNSLNHGTLRPDPLTQNSNLEARDRTSQHRTPSLQSRYYLQQQKTASLSNNILDHTNQLKNKQEGP